MSGVFLHRETPRFALLFNLKVGYTTLSRALAPTFPAVERLRAPRFEGPALGAIPTFLIVRNPFDRVASFFADKCRAQPRARAAHGHKLQDCQRLLLRGLGRLRGEPDHDFAALLSLQLDDLAPVLAAIAARDAHLTPQVNVLRVPWFARTAAEALVARVRVRARGQATAFATATGAAHARLARATFQLHARRTGQPRRVPRLVMWPDQLLRMERLADDWPRFEAAVGRSVPLVAQNAQSAKIDPPRWTPRLVAEVQDIYAEDFAAFDYALTPVGAENLAAGAASGQHSAHGQGNP